LVEREDVVDDIPAPAWFVKLLPLASRPGVAQVSDGWKPIGQIEVISHSAYAYQHLWESTYQAAIWLACVIGLIGAFSTWLLGTIKKPLTQAVAQARAICERQFNTIAEPRVPELRQLTQAMNSMAIRLKEIFNQQAAQIEHMRREASVDRLSGVAHRQHFLNQFNLMLTPDEQSGHTTLLRQGVFCLIRLQDLAEANKTQGHQKIDQTIQALGARLQAHVKDIPDAFAGRLNGSDFAVILPCLDLQEQHLNLEVQALWQSLLKAMPQWAVPCRMGASVFTRTSTLAKILARADLSLAAQESHGAQAPRVSLADNVLPGNTWGEQEWRQRLQHTLHLPHASQHLQLATYPVRGLQNKLIHFETPVRLRLESEGDFLPAAEFVPMLLRLEMTALLDEQVLLHALQYIQSQQHAVAINMAAESLADPGFILRIIAHLQASSPPAQTLWIEFPESALFAHANLLGALSGFIRALTEYGVQVGVEHAGANLAKLQKLHAAGIHYMKLDAAYIQGVAESPPMASFIQSAVSIAHGMGIQVFAEGVNRAEDLARIEALGLDGWTGRAVS
jgi:EAL domain-containing protein (putative c-di-GMP-specific phosphodiesterase class I)/GGDEF domain-containing protein